MPISIRHKGDFEKTTNFLIKMSKRQFLKRLDEYGQMGVNALKAATPVRTGKTASSWAYEIRQNGSDISLVWTNSNKSRGVPIVFYIQYGHGTKSGRYVQGYDFINPAIKPVFDQIKKDIWGEVTSA